MEKPSWLYWLIAGLAILWQGMGLFDYWMTASGNQAYLKDYPQEMILWIKAFPFWRDLMWAISVVSGFLGALALLFRRRSAVTLLMTGFILMVTGFIGHDLLLSNGAEIYGLTGLIFSGFIIVISAFLWWWARRARARGILT